jgi:hypothetical protein
MPLKEHIGYEFSELPSIYEHQLMPKSILQGWTTPFKQSTTLPKTF